MIATACFLIFIAFFIFYRTSGKVKGDDSFMHKKISANKLAAKVISLLLLMIAFGVLIATQGFCAGTFYGFIILMVSGSLVVLLAPLEVFTARSVLPLFVVFLMVECFLMH